MVEFTDEDLQGSRFRRVDLSGSHWHGVMLRNARFTDTWIDDAEISGEIGRLTVNGVDGVRAADLLRTASDDDLQRIVDSPNGGTTSVMECVHVVLNEEWWHHQYANRDLDTLERHHRADPNR